VSASTHGIGAAERDVLLALADDEHLMGQRHTEWIGVAPFIEEDLAFASIGQDELGHAAMLYELLDDDADRLAFRRDPDEYRSCWLTEATCADWAAAIVRHWMYDEAEALRWQALSASTVEPIRDVALRALQEETYHRRHAAALLDALWGDPEAQRRLRDAASSLMPLALALFDEAPGRDTADPGVVGAPLTSLVEPWTRVVESRLGRFAPSAPDSAGVQQRRTIRSGEFAEMYSRMREVLMLDPTARW
jgi:ring-1,2-phenylacetyl-CoA epoxidase subunit PaaC